MVAIPERHDPGKIEQWPAAISMGEFGGRGVVAGDPSHVDPIHDCYSDKTNAQIDSGILMVMLLSYGCHRDGS